MSMRLLVVDDERQVVGLLKAYLEPSGADVVGFTDSLMAAEWVEQQRFDGIILDVQMPDLDGFELTRRTRASSLNSKTPVVMLTGLDDVDTMRRGFSVGVTCFLGKPITRDRVRRLLSAMRGPILIEQRRTARLPYRTKVECLGGSRRQKRFIAESLNIGEGGMLMQSSGGFAVGDAVTLEFHVPTSNRPLRLQAIVLRLEPPDRVATQFLGNTIREQEAIRDFIAERLQQLERRDRRVQLVF